MKKAISFFIFITLASYAFAGPQQWHFKIAKSRPSAPVAGISEDFTSCDNFTSWIQTVSCSGGVAVGTTWEQSFAYHNTELLTQGQWVQADVYVVSGSDTPLLGLRGTTLAKGYHVYFDSGTIYVYNQAADHVLGSYAGSYATGTYTVKMEVTAADNVKVYVGGTLRINEDEAGTKPTGTRLYIGIDRDTADAAGTIDNLTAGDL